MYRDSAQVVAVDDDLAGVQSRSHAEAERGRVSHEGDRGVDATTGAVERREEPVAGALDDSPAAGGSVI
jgi:hypothetical protein